MKRLTIVGLALVMQCQAGSVLAQMDPDYGIEVQNNTVCSFINANNVRIRQAPNRQSATIAILNRGDGVRAIGREGQWVQVAARSYGTPPQEEFRALQGWVSNRLINGCSEDQFDRWRK